MLEITSPAINNRLLVDLPNADRLAMMRHVCNIELEFGTILCEPEQTLRHVYFPLSGFISLLATVPKHPPLEMGMIGSEGMLGATLLLGVKLAPLKAVVQGAGTALRMSAAQLRREIATRPALRATLGRYLYVLNVQLSQSAACTRFHEVDQRLARWLLMTYDRAHEQSFYLTHQFLADMLGVQRSAVTIAAGGLARKKLISYARGTITVLSRAGLAAASCTCYGTVEADYQRLFN
jgi:CRP-like cAMP-binding protein